MDGSPVGPLEGLLFALLIFGWLTCDHFGWDDRVIACYADAGQVGSPADEGSPSHP